MKMSSCRCGGWLAGLLLLLTLVPPAAAQKGPILREVEEKLLQGGYLETLHAAYWAAQQGEAIVPLLAQMLDKRRQYEKAGATGAFPFNALWALAHLNSEQSLQVLESYYGATRDRTAALAIKGWQLRQARKGPNFGVLLNEANLLEGPREKAPVLKWLAAGQAVRIVQEKVVNPKETGPRLGLALYDKVQVLPDGEVGYVPRAGDGFTPFI